MSDHDTYEDQRTHLRGGAPVWVNIGDLEDAVPYDLSASGMRIALKGTYEVGQSLVVGLHVADRKRAAKVTAKVVWTGADDMIGLEFVNLSPALRKVIDAAVHASRINVPS